MKYNSMSNLKQLMEERFQCQVEIENDAHCAAQCEQWIGNLQGIDNAIVLTFGTGIGGCFIFNGKPYKGTHQFAGEVSTLITNNSKESKWGPQCICIGGGASANPLFIDSIRKAMNNLYDSLSYNIPRLEIIPCLYYNDSNLIGAMHHYIMKSI